MNLNSFEADPVSFSSQLLLAFHAHWEPQHPKKVWGTKKGGGSVKTSQDSPPELEAKERNRNTLNGFETDQEWWNGACGDFKKELGKVCHFIVKAEKGDCNAVGLSWGWGLSTLPGALANGHFSLSKPDIESSWHLMGREQRCSLMSCCPQDPSHQQRNHPAPNARALIHPWATAGAGTG